MIVVIGSTNPTKINPVKKVFKKHFTNLKFKGVKVTSGVKEQPLSDLEMFQGALNRAKTALSSIEGADFGVGIEGGLHKYEYGWLERSTVVIVNKAGDIGIGSTGGIVLPQKVIDPILAGKDLEQVMDSLFGTEKIGRGVGMFGLLTKNVVTRSKGVEHGVAFALARFLHEDLFS